MLEDLLFLFPKIFEKKNKLNLSLNYSIRFKTEIRSTPKTNLSISIPIKNEKHVDLRQSSQTELKKILINLPSGNIFNRKELSDHHKIYCEGSIVKSNIT